MRIMKINPPNLSDLSIFNSFIKKFKKIKHKIKNTVDTIFGMNIINSLVGSEIKGRIER
tara:strand:+ start:979 stop:1155 length:177 start_codon:yes stop_codon:yes gene_type:complete